MPSHPPCRDEQQRRRWAHLTCLLAALALTPACGDDSGGGNEAGAGGTSAGAGGSGTAGSSNGGSSNGGSSNGGSSNGGSSGSAGASGSAGDGPDAGGPDAGGESTTVGTFSITSGGSVAKSQNFTLIGTVGEAPGGNLSMTSTNNRLDLGLVGATQ